MSDDDAGGGSPESLAGSCGQMGSDESGIKRSARHSVVLRQGNPNEFDEQDTTTIVSPDDTSAISVPPGVLRRLLANPAGAPALLAARAVEQLASRTLRDVGLIRECNPEATDRQLAI